MAFNRAIYIFRIFWRFRFYLLAALSALVLWDTLLIKPFRLFVIVVHEVCHAAAALLTGGSVVEMRMNWSEGGHTLTQGGYFPIISAAGYVGSAIVGALLIYTSVAKLLQRLLLLLVGASSMGMTMWYTPTGGLDFYLGIFGGLALMAAAFYSASTAKAAAVWMGTMLCLYSLFDFYTDLGSQAEATDAGILATYWGYSWLAYPIAFVWVVLSLACMYRAMRALVRST
jgi:hypothetical protein